MCSCPILRLFYAGPVTYLDNQQHTRTKLNYNITWISRVTSLPVKSGGLFRMNNPASDKTIVMLFVIVMFTMVVL